MSLRPAAPARKVQITPADRMFNLFAHVVLIIWVLIVIIPMLWALLSSFKTSSEIFASPFSLPETMQWDNYVRAWTDSGIGRSFVNTLIVVFSALFLVMLLGSMCAYILARFKFRGSRLIYWALLAGLTFPLFLAMVPLNSILKNMELLSTKPGLIITYVAFALPFTVFFLYAFFRTLPLEIQEAAYVDGAGEWTTFFRIMLPMAGPGMASVAIFNFLGLWNQYLIPISINTKEENYVLSQALGHYLSLTTYEVDYGGLFAAVIITIVPVLITYIVFQRQLQGSVSKSTIK